VGDLVLAAPEQETLVLSAGDERFDLFEIVDRDLADVAVLLLGKERAGAEEAEEFFIDVARRGEVDGADALLERPGGGAQDGAAERGALAGKCTADAALFDEGKAAALGIGEAAGAVEQQELEDAEAARELLSEDWKQVHEGLEVRLVPAPDGEEVFILCRSAERQAKEQAMHERFEKRIEEGLLKIAASGSKRRQQSGAVERRVGRLLERNSRAARLFEVRVVVDAQGFPQLRWTKVESWREWARRSEGCYLLRSNVTDWTPEELWRAYVQLTEAEAAFRVHKSDLQIRPVWHHREHRVGAHILVCFLAYVLWKTLAASCRQGGLGDEPRQIFEELCEISLVDVILPTRNGVEVRKRCISQPTEHQRILLQRLGMRLPMALEQTQM